MSVQIRAQRLEVTDRYPMLAFSLQSSEGSRLAEVVLLTDLALIANPGARNPANFYSSREHSVLAIADRGSLYTVPPQVLARFIGGQRLYFGLATASAPGGQDWRVDVLPGDSSPYVSLRSLSDRALRRVRMYPAQTRTRSGPAAAVLAWAGDRAASAQSAPVGAGGQPAMPTGDAPGVTPAPVPYNDGFGPLPPLQPTVTPSAPAAQGLGSEDEQGIEGPVVDELVPAVAAGLTIDSPLTSPDYPGARLMPSPAFSSRGGTAIDRIVIHITSSGQSPYLGSHFTRPDANSSSHYMIDQNGAIIQFVREQDKAWHARRANARSIGIEHVAVERGGARYGSHTLPYTPPTQVELETSAQLVAHLCRKYGLSPDRTTIVGHNEIDTGTSHSLCPTGAWDWDGYMQLVAAAFAASPANGVSDQVPAATAQGLGQSAAIDPESRGIEGCACSDHAGLPAATPMSLTSAEYVRARAVPSPAFTAGRAGQQIQKIVIHITDAPTTSSTVNHFTSASARASAHYLVGQDGEIVQFVSEADTAWHARGSNRNSIGIEHVAIKAGGADYPRANGTTQHFDALAPSDVQYCESAALVAHLCDKYGIVPSRQTIIGHNEADPNTSHTSCPVGNWNWDHYMRLVSERVCAPQPTAQGLARALAGGGDTIEIKYRAFIPSPALKGPFFDNYHGDGRGFSYSSGTSRGEVTFTVDVSPGGGLSNLAYVSRDWSPSHSYSASDTSAVAGKPDWWLSLNAGAVPTDTASCPTNDDTLRAFIGSDSTTTNVLAVAENASLVTIAMAGNNPLVPGSPAIDATVAVLIRRNASGGIEAKVFGSHDGFPAHELYVNRQRLYAYDPVAAGNSPENLFPPEDISADTGWTSVAGGTASTGQALDTGSDPEDGEISGPVIDLAPQTGVASASALALTDAEYPDAVVMPSPAFTRGRAGKTIDRIVIHITSSGQSPYLGSWFTRENANSSAHYMVDQLGTVRQFVAEADTAWHAGNRDFNRRSIGIEHVAVERGGATYGSTHLPYTPPSDIEYRTSAGLVAHLCRKYNLTPDRTTIVGHNEANPQTTHSSCPTGAWDWDLYMGLVAAAYALQAGARAVGSVVDAVRGAVGLGADDWSINWDEVDQVAQPTNMGCWATSAAMITGWRDRVCIDPNEIARMTGLEPQMASGLSANQVKGFLQAVGLRPAPAACFSADGFRDLLERNGPAFVVARVPGLHAIVVTGMYRKDGQDYVRITDPWDRVVGHPGAPGAYAASHSTGSRYIMTYPAFAAEYEATAGWGEHQLAFGGVSAGRQPNRGSDAPAGYAQSLGDGAGAADVTSPAATSSRRNFNEDGRSYDLAQLAGMVRPPNAMAGGAGMPAIAGERVLLNDWPYIDDAGARTQADVAIDWKFDGAAVGDIVIAPAGGTVSNGRSVAVRADIEPAKGSENQVVMLVRVTTTFSKPGEPDQVAVNEVTLSGSGRSNRTHVTGQEPQQPTVASPQANQAALAQPVMA